VTGVLLELRRGPGRWMALPLLVLGALIARDAAARWSVGQWSTAVTSVSTAVLLMGPLAAAVGAYAGGRCSRRRTGHLERLAARDPAQAGLSELAALLIWASAAYAGVVLSIFVPTALQATWSGPNLPRTLAAGLGLLLETVLGYLAGRLLPYRGTPVAMAALVYLGSGLLPTFGRGRSVELLSPVNLTLYDFFGQSNVWVSVGQIAFYLGLGGLLAMAWARWVGRSRAWHLPLAGATVLAALGAGVVLSQPSNGLAPTPVPQWQCRGADPQICLHPALRAGRPQVEEAVQPVTDRLRGTPFALRRLEHRQRGLGSIPSPGAVSFALDDLRPGSVRLITQDVAANAYRFAETCFAPGITEENSHAAQLLGAWTAGNLRLFAPADPAEPAGPAEARALAWVRSASTADVHALLARSAAPIRACRLVMKDFR
jgi:hypothetical protein